MEQLAGPLQLRAPFVGLSGVLEVSHDGMYRHTTFPSTDTWLLVPSAFALRSNSPGMRCFRFHNTLQVDAQSTSPSSHAPCS